MLDMNSWVQKGANIAPLAVHTLFRFANPSDPLSRDDLTSLRKLDGDGIPDERKITLGWIVDTKLFESFFRGGKELSRMDKRIELNLMVGVDRNKTTRINNRETKPRSLYHPTGSIFPEQNAIITHRL